MRAVAARVRLRSRGDAPAVEQSADRGYGKRVSAKQTSRRVCMGSSEGRQGARGRPGQRRGVMRPPRFDAEVAMRNEPVAARLPSGAALARVFPLFTPHPRHWGSQPIDERKPFRACGRRASEKTSR
jgi:hypothetical protein